jgi:hypothetical protein
MNTDVTDADKPSSLVIQAAEVSIISGPKRLVNTHTGYSLETFGKKIKGEFAK